MDDTTMSFIGLTANNEMIGYLDGYVLIENEWGDLFVSKRPEEFYFPGEIVESDSLTPLSDLPEEEQKKFQKYLCIGKEGR